MTFRCDWQPYADFIDNYGGVHFYHGDILKDYRASYYPDEGLLQVFRIKGRGKEVKNGVSDRSPRPGS